MKGIPNKVLAEGVGISVGCASKIWRSYVKEGSKAIKLGVRGRRMGEKRTLTIKQEAQVRRAYEQSSEAVKKWLEERKEQIEVFYLPSYSPELNPDEYLTSYLKTKVHSGIPICNRKDSEMNDNYVCNHVNFPYGAK